MPPERRTHKLLSFDDRCQKISCEEGDAVYCMLPKDHKGDCWWAPGQIDDNGVLTYKVKEAHSYKVTDRNRGALCDCCSDVQHYKHLKPFQRPGHPDVPPYLLCDRCWYEEMMEHVWCGQQHTHYRGKKSDRDYEYLTCTLPRGHTGPHKAKSRVTNRPIKWNTEVEVRCLRCKLLVPISECSLAIEFFDVGSREGYVCGSCWQYEDLHNIHLVQHGPVHPPYELEEPIAGSTEFRKI